MISSFKEATSMDDFPRLHKFKKLIIELTAVILLLIAAARLIGTELRNALPNTAKEAPARTVSPPAAPKSG
jgi:hypothetical protein